jgi:urease accessory protein
MADPRLHLLHLSSPTLPIGAYAYSQGLEYAIEAGWLDGDGLRNWLHDGLHLGVATLDLPILGRAHGSSTRRAPQALDAWNDLLLACRETYELLLEDQQVGAALWRLLASLGVAELPALRQAPGYAVAFAVACAHWASTAIRPAARIAFPGWKTRSRPRPSWYPSGRAPPRRCLSICSTRSTRPVRQARAVRDEAIGLSCPGLALASCRHEHQHTRLFRS